MKTWKPTLVFIWEEAPFFRLFIPLIAGIVGYEKFSVVCTSNIIISVLLSALLLATGFLLLRSHTLLSRIFQSALLFFALFALGYGCAFQADIRNNKNWFGHDYEQTEACVATVLQEPLEKERTWKLSVAIEKEIKNGTMKAVTGKAFVYVYKNGFPLRCHAGEKIIIPSSWQRIKNSGNPHEFDYALFCNHDNIYFQQFLNAADVLPVSESAPRLSLAVQTHEWAMKQFDHYVKDKSVLGLLQAMLVGDEINFTDEDKQLYVDTGIIHIVAISGGHIAFLLLLITGALSWIKNRKYQWIKLAVAFPIVVFYVMVAGAPPSAVRAAVVFSLLALSTFIGKDNHPLNSLLAAAFIILLLKPFWLFSVGFQLSFIAVLSLILFYTRIYKLYLPGSKIIKFLWSAFAASIAAELLIAPLVIFYFHLFPVSFLLANLVATLLMTIIMSLGLGILLFAGLPVFAKCLANIITGIVLPFQAVISALRTLNFEEFKFLHLSFTELLLCYIIIGFGAYFIIEKSKTALFTTLSFLCILFFSFVRKEWNALQQESFVIYNIPKHTYAEYLSGYHFSIVSASDDSISEKKIDYAIKENHVATRSWKRKNSSQQDIVAFLGRRILFLKSALKQDTAYFRPVDYLVITYPVKNFDAVLLQQKFHFKKLVITGEQRRKSILKWRDSCENNNIDAHFTMLDGAFTINSLQ